MAPIQEFQRWLPRLILAAVAAQFVLAGAGAFGATSFKPHTAIDWATGALLLAVVGVQVAVGVLGDIASAWFGAVHGLDALIVAGAAVNLARRTQTSHEPVNHTQIGTP
jgi:hypothetical protein